MRVLGETMVVFISGPMSGHPNYNFDAFSTAEKKLAEAGYRVFNPAKYFDIKRKEYGDKLTREKCNALAISILLGAHAIYSLAGWENSDGAKLERSVAEAIGLKIIELGD